MTLGRPTLCTPEVQGVILRAIAAGNYRVTACQMAGIHRNTLINWETWAKEGKAPYVDFLGALQKAEAEAEALLLQHVAIGGDGWQSKAWILERRWPGRWSGRVRLQVHEELGLLTDKLRKSLDQETYRKVLDVTTREDAAGAEGAREGAH